MITTSPAVDESLMSSETEGWLPDFAFIFLAGGCLANQVAECCVEVCLAIPFSECFDFDASFEGGVVIKRLHLQKSSGQGPLPQVSTHQLSVAPGLMATQDSGSTRSGGGAPS